MSLLGLLARVTRRLIDDQRGYTIVFFALGCTGLLGATAIAVDVGHLAEMRRQVQNAADAAALAGAARLPIDTNGADSLARTFASLNGRTGDVVTTSMLQTTVSNDTIEVRVNRTVPLFFARALGLTSSTTSATARAQVGSVGSTDGLMPFGVACPTPPCFTFGQRMELKLLNGSQGNYNPIRIDGSGASVYSATIVNGSSQPLSVGQWVNPEPGNMVGPTRDAITTRLAGDNRTFSQLVQTDSSGRHQIVDRTSRRIVIIPFVTNFVNGNSSPVRVTGFGLFYMEGLGSGASVWGNFIDAFIPNGQFTAYNPSLGAQRVRLTQ
jgi:Flp pilus assembly protein TadG